MFWEKTVNNQGQSSFLRKLVKWALVFCVALSLVIIVVYAAGNDFADETLFFLLWVLRCVSIFICMLSILSMIFNILLAVRGPSPVLILCIILYFLGILWGAALVVFNSLIVVIAGGNL